MTRGSHVNASQPMKAKRLETLVHWQMKRTQSILLWKDICQTFHTYREITQSWKSVDF